MIIGICGIACERCPRRDKDACPNGREGCTARDNPHCRIATCAFHRGVKLCFECPAFPCDNTKTGPLNYGYCQYIACRDINGR